MGRNKKNDEYLEWFGINLTNALNQKGLSAKEVADKMGVDKSTMSKWCNGKIMPFTTNVSKLASILEIPPTALFIKGNTRLGENLAKIAMENKEIDDLFLDKYVNVSDEIKQKLLVLIDVLG